MSHKQITWGGLTVLLHEMGFGLQEEGFWFWDFEGNTMHCFAMRWCMACRMEGYRSRMFRGMRDSAAQ